MACESRGAGLRGRVSGRGGRGTVLHEGSQGDRLRSSHSEGATTRKRRVRRLKKCSCSSNPASTITAAEETGEIVVVVFPKGSRYAVQSNGIDAGIEEAEAETDDTNGMPKRSVITAGEDVVPKQEHIGRQEAHGEDKHEGKHDFGYFPPRPKLPVENVRLPRYVVSGEKMSRHQKIENCNH